MQTNLTRIYYRDDFTVKIRLRCIDRDGNETDAGLPPFDWRARLSTSGSQRFVAIASNAGEPQGWEPAGDGAILVRLDRHGLMPGRLHAEFAFALPDSGFPDGSQKLVRSYDLGVELTADPRDIPSAAAATLDVPWLLIKGDSAVMTYIELVTDTATYLVPVCGELPCRKADPDNYGDYYGTDFFSIGSWDD